MAEPKTGDKRSYTFIVEHLDPELEQWQALEYNAIHKESVETGNTFLLSGLTPQFDSAQLLKLPASNKTQQTVESLYSDPEQRKRICLLDPKASKDLGPDDGDEFDSFLFGGILGDDPPRDRTADLRKLGYAGRRLGPEQMTTDTAVRVTRMVVTQRVKLDEIPYVNQPDFEVVAGDGQPGESVSMPFKYVQGKDGKPILPKGMLELLASDADKGIMDLL